LEWLAMKKTATRGLPDGLNVAVVPVTVRGFAEAASKEGG
jgi:hypothetical protein